MRVPWALSRAALVSVQFLDLFTTQLAVICFSSSVSLGRASSVGDPVILTVSGLGYTRVGISPNIYILNFTIFPQVVESRDFNYGAHVKKIIQRLKIKQIIILLIIKI